ncbi:UNVERIFIED_CONTAM: hypothetical protein FKN15_020778 [Acipenser sinensis]
MAQAPSPHSPDQAVAQKETVQAQTDKAQGQKELKIGGFDGKASWEAYRTKFELVAEINGWDTKRKADRLIAALEGEALHTLLEVSKPERRSYEAVVQALDCRIEGTENPLTLRQQLKDHFRHPGEPLGQFAANVCYLARQAHPEFPTAIQEKLATDAFLHGLTPGAVRNQVRLDTPQTLDATLARAKLAEVVLGEQSPLPSTAKHPPHLPQEDTLSYWNSLSMVSCLLSLGEAVLLLMEYLIQVSEIVGNGSFCWHTVCPQVSMLELAPSAGARKQYNSCCYRRTVSNKGKVTGSVVTIR